MRHGKKFNHLGRTASHRKAMLSNMAVSLIEHKQIKTTLAKAKALRKFVEPLVTKSKTDTMESRKLVFSKLQDKEAVNILFNEVAQKIADRPGGYTRILKLGNRLGDNAEMCLIELVDYNELTVEDKPKSSGRRRRRRGGSSTAEATTTTPNVEATTVTETEEIESTPVAEEATEEVTKEKKEDKE